MIQYFAQNWHNLLLSAIFIAVAIAVAMAAHFVAFWLLRKLASRKKTSVLDQSLIRHGEGPTRLIFPLLAVLVVLPGLPLTPTLMSALEHITGLGLIAAIAWLLVLTIDITADLLGERYRIDVADNLLARRVQTQFQMMRRILIVVVAIITLAIMLMTFPAIKHIGVSLLASAGLAGLVVGMAMKGTLTNLIASVQIAFSQPFRLGDAVIVEGEFGWIEEIGTMYVTVRIWDLRRLVLPLSYFLDHPFQNWTRTSAELLANTLLHVDYTVPMEELRQELKRICESSKLWGGKVCVLQVSDASEHTVQLRALMDARNSSDAWDIRCLVREKLIEYLQKNYPGSLPRYRGEWRVAGEAGARGDTPGDSAISMARKSPAAQEAAGEVA
jgi:small-conductance mechanosensitive channel